MTKWQTCPSFQQRTFLSPHRYNPSLRAHLTSNWPQIFTKCYRGFEVSSTGRFWSIAFSTYWWRHQMSKAPQSAKHWWGKKVGLWVCAQHQLLKISHLKIFDCSFSVTFSSIPFVFSGNRYLISVIWRAVSTKKYQ